MSTRPAVTGVPSQVADLAPPAMPPRARVGGDSFKTRPGETVTTLARAVAPRYSEVASGSQLVDTLTSLLVERGLADATGALRACEVVPLPSGSELRDRHTQLLRTGQLGDRIGSTTARQSVDLQRLVSPRAAPTSPAGALAPRATCRDLEDLPLAPIPPPNPERISPELEPIPLPPRAERGQRAAPLTGGPARVTPKR